MEYTDFQINLADLLPDISIKMNEPLEKHTSFHIGGPAEAMAFPKTPEQLSRLLKTSKLLDAKVSIIGAGTNILAPDRGISGLVICLKDSLDAMEQLDATHIRVASGVTMSRAAVYASKLNLGGMEFAHGIPGSVGGGVYMNAGAYGGEICQICESVDVMFMDGSRAVWSQEDMQFSYRHSRLEDENGIVLSAVFKLIPRPEKEIREQMMTLMAKRKESQPLDKPSAGSAFKRPAGGYAAALIEDTGLKGFRVGDAAVSSKHSGFVVNLGHATSEDVKKVLSEVSDRVMEKKGIRLEPEIRIW